MTDTHLTEPDELRELVERYLATLELHTDLGGLQEAARYAVESGGKRIRPVLCVAVAEAAGAPVEDALPAAAALELVHTFSLVHDDLPALDDDDERRGRPSAHVAFDEGVAILAGDALVVEAIRLALSYETLGVAQELVAATLRMIGGQYRDISGDVDDLVAVERLKTGALFGAAVGLGVQVAGLPDEAQRPWRAFGDELGLLFQVVDDLLDGDGFAKRLGVDGARRLADESAERAQARLDAIPANTSTLAALVDELAVRTT
jgi:geranylgeranyl diphosphate synthase type II